MIIKNRLVCSLVCIFIVLMVAGCGNSGLSAIQKESAEDYLKEIITKTRGVTVVEEFIVEKLSDYIYGRISKTDAQKSMLAAASTIGSLRDSIQELDFPTGLPGKLNDDLKRLEKYSLDVTESGQEYAVAMMISVTNDSLAQDYDNIIKPAMQKMHSDLEKCMELGSMILNDLK